MENPYWAAVRDAVKASDFDWEGPMIGRFKFDWQEGDPPILDRHDFVGKYAWTVTDPVSVEFVATHAVNGLVDPMAGTGYWAYLLAQLGVDVACYDLQPGDNPWHSGEGLWVEVETMDGALAAEKHPDRTLLLAWPPYNADVGTRVLRAYQGQRVIYIGELGGCCGDDDMHEELGNNWEEVAERRPIQWYGLHDRITVYERNQLNGGVDDTAQDAAAAGPVRTGAQRSPQVQ